MLVTSNFSFFSQCFPQVYIFGASKMRHGVVMGKGIENEINPQNNLPRIIPVIYNPTLQKQHNTIRLSRREKKLLQLQQQTNIVFIFHTLTRNTVGPVRFSDCLVQTSLNKITCDQRSLLKNIVGKERENADYQHFLLFPHNIFYPFKDKSYILNRIWYVVCNNFEFG